MGVRRMSGLRVKVVLGNESGVLGLGSYHPLRHDGGDQLIPRF